MMDHSAPVQTAQAPSDQVPAASEADKREHSAAVNQRRSLSGLRHRLNSSATQLVRRLYECGGTTSMALHPNQLMALQRVICFLIYLRVLDVILDDQLPHASSFDWLKLIRLTSSEG